MMQSSQVYWSYMDSPIGNLLLAGDARALHYLGFPEGSMAREPEPGWLRRNSVFEPAKRQLDAYFQGRLTAFDLPLAPRGSDFQQAVWQAMLAIPYGETRSYSELAAAVGSPSASRAVGSAAGRNPIPVIIPCHRIIGSDGAMVGFGGGIKTKKYLLALEQSHLPFSLTAD